MSFDIKKHIKDHAEKIIDNLTIAKDQEDFIHFTTSVDTALLINQGYDSQDKIDNLMNTILMSISEMEIEVEEKNGIYVNKNNERIQKYRTRTIKFDKLLSAYHNKHFDDSKSVNPHLHFLGNKNARLGRKFVYLKQAIETEAKKFGLKFHFSDLARETGLTKPQEASIKTMSWIFNEGKTKKIETYLKDDDKLRKVLDLLQMHYLHSENISYFLKVMSIVNQRLVEMDVDYLYKDINLKDKICFSLTEEQEEKIKGLQEEEECELDLTKVFDREILKYAYGFGSDAMTILVDKFDILRINKEKLHIKSSDTKIFDVKKKSNFRDLVIQDIKTAISQAKDEKSLKQCLIDMGYKKASFKTSKIKDRKRQKTGMTLVTKNNMRLTIGFSELGMNWSNITNMLMTNQKKKKELSSQIENYKRDKQKKKDKLTLYEYTVRQLMTIYPKERINTKIVYNLAQKFKVNRSDMYNITTFTSDDSTIVDYNDKIVLKKSDSLKENVSDMLNLVELKGWKLSSLSIKGSRQFVSEAKKQINKKLGIKERKSVVMNNYKRSRLC